MDGFIAVPVTRQQLKQSCLASAQLNTPSSSPTEICNLNDICLSFHYNMLLLLVAEHIVALSVQHSRLERWQHSTVRQSAEHLYVP
jgi:hypothetical protein